ncbi:MAG: hypothetical protein Q8O55_06930 [Dehalococcoidales bacterium]|nr:hypothetical protein [Dehalococcoidales bacterium]
MKKAATIGVLAGMGVIAGSVLLATRAKAAPEEPETPGLIPSVDDILASLTMGELEIWYMYIGQLYFTGQIDRVTYETLYQAYVDRFYQLVGANQ